MKKIYSLILVIFIAGRIVIPVSVLAIDYPDRPDKPSVSSEEDSTGVDQPDSAEEPDTPDNYVNDDTPSPTPTPAPTATPTPAPSTQDQTSEQATPTPTPVVQEDAVGDDQNSGQIGDVEVETGDATISAALINDGNANIATDPTSPTATLGASDGVVIKNTDNTNDGSNSGSALLVNESDTTQINEADLDNNLKAEANTGVNVADRNIGNVSVDTGDANVTGTIINNINNNVSGAMYSEFNVLDGQAEDLVLDYRGACVSGCGGDIGLLNSGNSNGGDNSSTAEIVDSENTFQMNTGDLTNDMVLVANTGDNEVNRNTQGDTSINTGDANIAANILNFMNNNIAGQVIFGVVNIFGDFVGDIILPQSELDKYPTSPTATLGASHNANNGDNIADASLIESDEYVQFNNAEIINNIELDANTGENVMSRNTGGDNSIDTGDVSIDANITNIANNNLIGEDWWIVFVNESGNWVGKIINPFGTVVGNIVGGSMGTEVSGAGDTFNLSNNNNANDGDNVANLNSKDTSTTTQINNGKIVNNIKLDANTGGNEMSRNAGGDHSIKTGDADIKLNVMNFMNNNIIGGNVFVTFINVFGTWSGDFIAPGALKASEPQETSMPVNNEVADNNNPSSNSSSPSSETKSETSSSGSSSESVNVGSYDSGNLISLSRVMAYENGEEEDKEEGEVLGASTVNEKSAKRVRINFAWAMVILPLGYVTYRFGLLGKLAAVMSRVRK